MNNGPINCVETKLYVSQTQYLTETTNADNPLNNYRPKFLLLGNITALMTNNQKLIAAKTNTVRVTIPIYTYSLPPPPFIISKKNNI